jgi:hypothetical protein
MKVNWWALTIAVWTAFFSLIVIVVTIPDYPRTGKLWYNLCMDPNGYFHELFYVTVGWLSGLALILLALVFARIRSLLEAIEKIFKGV